MSTVKTFNLQHPSSSTVNMTLASDGSVSGGLPSPNRNLLYNGAMQVAQRGTSATGLTGGNYYTADRWTCYLASAGTWTNTVEADGPAGSGFTKSLKWLCTTANASLSAGSAQIPSQAIEGQDLQRLAYGSSAAQQVTLSFWVKSNVTGTYIAELDGARQVSASYTISASGTWERKYVTFPANTVNAITNDNTVGMSVRFWMAAGSTFSGGSSLQTAWGSTQANRAYGQVNVAAAVNNYWQVTGVQLETGPAPTAFEFKPYAQELRDCQRYYYRPSGFSYATFGSGFSQSATIFFAYIPFPIAMRTAPSNTVEFANLIWTDRTAYDLTVSSFTPALTNCTTTGMFLYGTCASGAVSMRPGFLSSAGSTTGYVGITAEL